MSHPILVGNTNLSHAWAEALLRTARMPLNSPPPLCVTIFGFEHDEPAEDPQIRDILSSELAAKPNKHPIDDSALVIFPYRAWVRHGRPTCPEFSRWCLDKFIPRLKARHSNNRRGLYFERMMAFRYYDSQGQLHEDNQLQYVVDWWKRRRQIGTRPRRSGLQVSCFDPREDHNEAPLLPFPCLQQIGFTYDKDGGLIVNAFYPTQFILDRAYGNYLGLCHLGAFMAYQIGVRLVRMNCFVGCAQLGSNVTKKNVDRLLGILRKRVVLQEA